MSETEDAPPTEPPKPKRLSFREANLGPAHEPEPLSKPQGFFSKRKRTVSITLLAVGAGAAALYGATHRNPNCDQYPPDQQASCRHGSGGGGGHSFGSSSSGGSSSEASAASRGGFGSTGAAHGGGGE